MPIILDELTVRFEHIDVMSLVEDWRWLIGERKRPLLITALGDMFVQDIDDGAVDLLSAGEGALLRVAGGSEEFQTLLGDPAFVEEHFAPGLVATMRAAGQRLTAGQLYGYRVPPRLGGQYSAANLEPTDIEVHFSLLGQINRQT